MSSYTLSGPSPNAFALNTSCLISAAAFGSKEDSSGKDRRELVVSAASEGGKPIERHVVHLSILNPKVFELLTLNRFLLLST